MKRNTRLLPRQMSPGTKAKLSGCVIVAAISYLLVDTIDLVYQYPVTEVL